MPKPRIPRPVALTIAGSDSGGGAGIQADLKTFASLGVHGTSAITCVTAQNPVKVSGIQACSAALVRKQIAAVFDELPPAAVKTGMLYSADTIRVVADWFRWKDRPALIVDPVMVATSGARLIKSSTVEVLRDELLPRATLVTPNVSEVQILSGLPIEEPEDLRRAARRIHAQSGCAVLVKGGHLTDVNEAIDIFYDGDREWMLGAPFVRGIATHGTGCTYSAAITAYMALGCELFDAIRSAKEFITQAISQSYRAGRHQVLDQFWRG